VFSSFGDGGPLILVKCCVRWSGLGFHSVAFSSLRYFAKSFQHLVVVVVWMVFLSDRDDLVVYHLVPFLTSGCSSSCPSANAGWV